MWIQPCPLDRVFYSEGTSAHWCFQFCHGLFDSWDITLLSVEFILEISTNSFSRFSFESLGLRGVSEVSSSVSCDGAFHADGSFKIFLCSHIFLCAFSNPSHLHHLGTHFTTSHRKWLSMQDFTENMQRITAHVRWDVSETLSLKDSLWW